MRASFARLGAAMCSGVAVAFAFEPFGLVELLWFGLIPLLAALWSVSGPRAGWQGAFFGLVAGGVANGILFSWIGVVSSLGAVLLPAYISLFWAAFGAFAATWAHPWQHQDRHGQKSGNQALQSLGYAAALGFVWAGLELLRGWLFTGFSWNTLGVAFHERVIFAQAADLFGVSGLSALVVMFQAVLLQAGLRLVRGQGRLPWRSRWDFALIALVVMATYGYGWWSFTREGKRPGIPLRALLVQVNIPQEAARVLWEGHEIHAAYEEETKAAFEALEKENVKRLQAGLKAAGGQASTTGKEGVGEVKLRFPHWVLWPESALAGRLLTLEDGRWAAYPNNLETIAQVQQLGQFTLIYGVVENEGEASQEHEGMFQAKADGRVFNSIAIQGHDGKLQVFRKRHLVIFGEYIPMVEKLPWLKKIYEQQAGVAYSGAFDRGESLEPLPVQLDGEGVSIIPSVCFEDTVARQNRRMVRAEPQILVNLTNDGWFQQTAAAAQHFATARFRAIELRRPMLRCANTGVSAAIDHRGSVYNLEAKQRQVLVDAQGSHFTRGSLLTELRIPRQPGRPGYVVWGDWPLALAAGTSMVLCACLKRRKARVSGAGQRTQGERIK